MPLYPGYADVDGQTITVDQALNNPTMITAHVAENIHNSVLVDKVFGAGGNVEGGAVIYSPVTEKHLYTENDVKDRAPGNEYPVLYSTRPESQIARVSDFGGRFAVTDEARRRNQTVDFDNDVTRMGNTITRKLNQRVSETLKAGLDSLDDGGIIEGHSWSGLTFGGANPTPESERPTADFAAAQLAADLEELDIVYSMLLVHPTQRAALKTAYGKDMDDMLASSGLTLETTTHIPAGEAYMVDPGSVGFVSYEEQLTTETYDDRQNRQTWVQGYAMPVMGVTAPRAVRRITGLNN